MAAIHWADTKGVHILSTAADPVAKGGVAATKKSGEDKITVATSPIQLLYSEHMQGVDVHDEIWSTYPCAIATKKWWHRLLFFLMDTASTNAYILHSEGLKATGKKPITHKKFQMTVAIELMEIPPSQLDDNGDVILVEPSSEVATRVAQRLAQKPRCSPQN